MHKLTSSPYAAVFVGAVLMLGLYVGAYYATVNSIVYRSLDRSHLKSIPYYSLGPSAKLFNDVAEPVFWPMHQIDRRLRPSVWLGVYPW